MPEYMRPPCPLCGKDACTHQHLYEAYRAIVSYNRAIEIQQREDDFDLANRLFGPEDEGALRP